MLTHAAGARLALGLLTCVALTHCRSAPRGPAGAGAPAGGAAGPARASEPQPVGAQPVAQVLAPSTSKPPAKLRPNPGVPTPAARRPVARGAYDLGRHVVMSAPGHQARVRGVVRWPADLRPDERAPLALIVHGNHGVCHDPDGEDRCSIHNAVSGTCPAGSVVVDNAAGMLWLADRLAAAGWVAVSVDANTVNCAGLPMLVQGRARLVVEHLRFWRFWRHHRMAPTKGLRAEQVDLGRTALIGHSNGAEAVARASSLLVDLDWDASLAGVNVRGVVTLASSDSSETRVRSAHLLHLTAGCDGQIPEHDGVRLLDRTLERRRAAVVQVVLPTVSHNAFNTSWGPKEHPHEGWVPCPGVPLSAPVRVREATLELVLPFLHHTVERQTQLPSWLYGDAAPPATLAQTGVDVRLHGYPQSHRLLERFGGLRHRSHGFLGGRVVAQGIGGGVCFSDQCSEASPNVTWATRVRWAAADAVLTQGLPDIDLSSWPTLALRVMTGPTGAQSATVPLSIGLRDREGRSAVVSVRGLRTARALPRYARGRKATPGGGGARSRDVHVRPDMLVSVRVPVTSFVRTNPALDLRRIAAVELRFLPGQGAQSLVLADIEATRP